MNAGVTDAETGALALFEKKPLERLPEQMFCFQSSNANAKFLGQVKATKAAFKGQLNHWMTARPCL